MSSNPEQPSRRFKANLVGNEYTIIGNASLGHLRSVTRLVNEQFSQIQLIAPDLSKEDQAMLLVFNAISDQLSKQEELENLQRELETNNNNNFNNSQPNNPGQLPISANEYNSNFNQTANPYSAQPIDNFGENQ